MAPSKADTEQRAERHDAEARAVLIAFVDDLTIPYELPPAGVVTIGRSSSCDVVIDHPSVSREHARLHVEDAELEDLGSRNGTSVRGVPVAPKKRVSVRPGDMIECGDATLLIRKINKGRGATASAKAAVGSSGLIVGADGRLFRLGADEVNLGRRGPLRKVLLALARQRVDSPGVGLSNEAVLEAGWPGEKMKHEAGLARVYTTIQRLRALGLHDVLVTHDDGYLFDPAVAARVEKR